MRELNEFNKNVIQTFASRQAYRQINGHYIPIIMNGITDESVVDVGRRRFYIQNYEFTMLAFLLDEDEFEVAPAVSRIFNTYELVNNVRQSKKKSFPEKSFVITAEIPKFWDASWDVISNSEFDYIPLEDNSYDFLSINRYDALDIPARLDVNLVKLDTFKFAGWLDLYNKEFYEKLTPVPEEWTGYGQWDLFSLLILYYIKLNSMPVSVAQYKLENCVTISIEYANWNYGENRSIYKSRLAIKETPNMRDYYSNNMHTYINNQLNKIVENSYDA
jgi:hypothetical protein